jgi:hypothetical protein
LRLSYLVGPLCGDAHLRLDCSAPALGCGAARRDPGRGVGDGTRPLLRVLPFFELRDPQLWRTEDMTTSPQASPVTPTPASILHRNQHGRGDSSLPCAEALRTVCSCKPQKQGHHKQPLRPPRHGFPLGHSSSRPRHILAALRPVPQAASIIPGPVPLPQQTKTEECTPTANSRSPRPHVPLFHSSRRMTDTPRRR